jgi:hypothetical protein
MEDEIVSVRDTMEALEESVAEEQPVIDDTQELEQISESENLSSAEDSTVEEVLEPEAETPQEFEPFLQPPASWKADEKEMFKTLPLEAQKVIARRESERDKGFYQSRQELAEIRQATAPYESELKRAGIPVSKAIAQMFEWDKHFRENPYEALAEMARKLGVDLRQVGQVVQAVEPQDPYVRQLMESNAQMQARFEAMEQEKNQVFRSSIESEVDAFASSKDAAGNPLFPYVENLAPEMEVLIPVIRRDNPNISTQALLKEAYERAMRSNPQTWNSYQKQLEQKQKQESQKRLQRAKNASSSVSGSLEGGTSKVQAPMSVRETMEAIEAGAL